VYDKKVRRRRAVLALLVGVSLVLLTAYFGESAGGALHSLQRGVLTVFAPIQEGASTVLKPFSNAIGWFGDTIHAKSQRDQLRKQVASLQQQLVAAKAEAQTHVESTNLTNLDAGSALQGQGVSTAPLAQYQPLTARVIVRSPTIWFATLEVDKGSGDGVRVDQPVVGDLGLVGRVSNVTSNAAQVTLITDHTSGVSARVLPGGTRPATALRSTTGVVRPAVGDPNDLLLDYIDQREPVQPGDIVVTAGSSAGPLESLFPPDIPIGQVTRVGAGDADVGQSIHLRPYADLRALQHVQILTVPHPGQNLRAQVPHP
jgi:rod shape-determining protein MreC